MFTVELELIFVPYDLKSYLGGWLLQSNGEYDSDLINIQIQD